VHVIQKILLDLENLNIKYCHFKSNQHVDRSFDGFSDFDVLVDNSKKEVVHQVLIYNGCKRFEPEYIGSYPGVENWFAFDENTGKIFHIHLHYQLISGKSLVKDYVFPWRDFALNNAIKDSKWDIYISNPNFEILLLITRVIVKSKLRDYISAVFGRYKIKRDMLIEYEYLRDRIDETVLKDYAYQLLSEKTADYLHSFILSCTTLRSHEFIRINRLLRKELKNHRRYNPLYALLVSIILRYKDLSNKVLSRKLGKNIVTRKVTSSGGKIIAFIGVDGCGKSTVSDEINKWLGRKFECKKFYMGSGDGKKNFFANFVSLLNKRLKKLSNETQQKNEKIEVISFKKEPIKYVKRYVRALVIYSVARGNRKKIIKMHRYRLNGGISVLDRYPQLEHENMNDGLKLRKYSKVLNSRFIMRLAQKEEKLMQIVNEIYPDIVFRLNISPEVSMARKPEEHHDINPLRQKVMAVKSLRFEGSKMIEVDAEQPYEEELLYIKKKIWECL